MDRRTFHWADYLVFGFSLAISLVIGIIFAFKQKTAKDLLLGGGKINFIPVAFSILASILNAIFIIGVPAEMYYFGVIFIMLGTAFPIMVFFTILIFVPTFRRMELTSAYQYFELRYDFKPLRLVASATFAISMIIFLSVVLYAPAFAFSQVTNIKLWVIIVACGLVCMLYTVLGGMKAVVWTDTVQLLIIIAGLVTMVIKGMIEVGGASNVYDRIKDNGRFDFTYIGGDHGHWDPRSRHTLFTQIFGQIFVWASVWAANQMSIQRYLSVKSTKQAQIAVAIGIGTILILMGLVSLVSFVMFTYYKDCDPLLSGKITKLDQIVPLFLMDLLGDLHGLPGLFTAAVFAASLSSISSAVNSLSAVLLEDFVKPAYTMTCAKEPLSERAELWTTRILAIIFGLMTVGLSFAAEYFGDNMVQLPLTIWGAASSPILGAFILGFFFVHTTGFGVMVGIIVSLFCNSALVYMGIWHSLKPIPIFKGLAVIPGPECIRPNGSSAGGDTSHLYEDSTLNYLSHVSYVWYGLIGVVVCIVIGTLVSFIELGCRCRTMCQHGRTIQQKYMFYCTDGFGSCCSCQFCVDCDLPIPDSDAQAMKYSRDTNTLEMKNNGRDNNGYLNDGYETNVMS